MGNTRAIERYKLEHIDLSRKKIDEAVRSGKIKSVMSFVTGSSWFKKCIKNHAEKVSSWAYWDYNEKDRTFKPIFTARTQAGERIPVIERGLLGTKREAPLLFKEFLKDTIEKSGIDPDSTLVILILPPTGNIDQYKKTIEVVESVFPYIYLLEEVSADLFLFGADESVVAIDIGHHTSDIAGVVGGRPIRLSADKRGRMLTSVGCAGEVVDMEIKRLIKSLYGWEITDHEARRIKEEKIAPNYESFIYNHMEGLDIEVFTENEGRQEMVLTREFALKCTEKLIRKIVEYYQMYINADEVGEAAGDLQRGGIALFGGMANITGLDKAVAEAMDKDIKVKRITNLEGKDINPDLLSAILGWRYGLWMFDIGGETDGSDDESS